LHTLPHFEVFALMPLLALRCMWFELLQKQAELETIRPDPSM
jgi:hypothetical protein